MSGSYANGLAKQLNCFRRRHPCKEARLAQGRFERLVLVAPPAALGNLRRLLPKNVRAKVIGDVAQDLVKTPKARLWPHLESVLGKAPPRSGSAV
jgi:protein required for attachment to host cells